MHLAATAATAALQRWLTNLSQEHERGLRAGVSHVVYSGMGVYRGDEHHVFDARDAEFLQYFDGGCDSDGYDPELDYG